MEEDPREVQQRHRAANDAAADSPASRGIVRREIESALREVGVNLADWDSTEEFRSTVRFAAELRADKDFWATYNFAKGLREKAIDAGKETRKGLIAALWGGVVTAIGAGITAFLATRGHQ